MLNPFSEALEDYPRTSSNHMSFEDACGYYGALVSGVQPAAISLAANVAQPTVSYLARAGEYVGGQIRYPRVAREYALLGHDAFIEKYVTPVLREHCVAAMRDLAAGVARPKTSTRVQPRRSGLIGRHILKSRSDFAPTAHAIEILEPTPEGYFYLALTKVGGGEHKPEHAPKYGPFKTAAAARRAARDYLTPEA